MEEKLQEVFGGARWVQFTDIGVFVWHGGHGVHLYDPCTLREINFYNVGDFANNEATLEEVKAGIETILNEQ